MLSSKGALRDSKKSGPFTEKRKNTKTYRNSRLVIYLSKQKR